MKPKPYMPALTGVRAIAAYLVFFHHNNYGPVLLRRVLWELHIGVNIFFVLSGFLIYYRYYNDFKINKAWISTYITNRIARIYPIYFILTLLTFAFARYANIAGPMMYGSDPINFWKLLLSNLTFLKGFFLNLNFTGIAQGWTLTVEECFYFLAPLFFLCIRKSNKFFIYLPLILFGAGLVLTSVFGPYAGSSHGFYSNNTFMALYTFNGTAIEFFMGMFLAHIILTKDISSYSKNPVFTFLGGLIMIASVAVLCSIKQTPTIFHGAYHPLGTVADHVFLSIGIALFFYGLITEQSSLKKFLSTKTMVLLGRSSYVFYLIHAGFIFILLQPHVANFIDAILIWFSDHHFHWFTRHTDKDGIVCIALTIGCMFILLNLISILIFKYIEGPLNKWIRKLAPGKRDHTQLQGTLKN